MTPSVPRRRRRRTSVALAAIASLTFAGLAPVAVSSSATATSEAFAPRLVTVDTPTRYDKQRLQKLGLDLTEHAGKEYVEVVLHNAADLTRLREAGFTWDVRIANLLERETEINALNQAFAAKTVRTGLPSGRDSYRTLDDYNADMEKLAEQRPRLVRHFALPHKSVDGRTVYGVEIGKNVRARDGRPTFTLFGLHHAREWPSGELAMEFAIDLTKSFGRNKRITNLLSRAKVIVVPVVNVDGFHLSRTDGAMIDLREVDRGGTASIFATPGNAYKRKNCRMVDGQEQPAGSCAAAVTSPGGFGIGVDLNRNYGGFWGGPGASGPTPDADGNAGVLDPTYRGPAPFSEPETQNVRELIRSRQVTMMISNHTFSNLVLRPNGVHPETVGHDGHPVGDAPDEAALKSLGARMTAQNGYANIHGWELYDTTGTTEDWSYNATGGFGYTFEIGAHEFHPPFEEVVDEYLGAGEYAGKGNRAAYLLALTEAARAKGHSVITGRAPRGAVLRLTKQFDSPTWESSFRERLRSTMRVRTRNGSFVWHVNPSTRPVVMEKRADEVEETTVREQEWPQQSAPMPVGASHTDHEFDVTETGVDTLRVALDWATPDDYDLEVYRRSADGSLVGVGSSGNVPGEKELVDIADPKPGTYVLRVVNFLAAAPYDLSAALVNSEVTGSKVLVPGKVERYTLTCQKKGKVLQKTQVRVDRGQQVQVALNRCQRLWRR